MYAERYPRKWFGGCPVEDTWEAVVNEPDMVLLKTFYTFYNCGLYPHTTNSKTLKLIITYIFSLTRVPPSLSCRLEYYLYFPRAVVKVLQTGCVERTRICHISAG